MIWSKQRFQHSFELLPRVFKETAPLLIPITIGFWLFKICILRFSGASSLLNDIMSSSLFFIFIFLPGPIFIIWILYVARSTQRQSKNGQGSHPIVFLKEHFRQSFIEYIRAITSCFLYFLIPFIVLSFLFLVIRFIYPLKGKSNFSNTLLERLEGYTFFDILLLFILITLVVASCVQMIIDFFDRKKDTLKKFLGSYKFNALLFLTLLTLLTLPIIYTLFKLEQRSGIFSDSQENEFAIMLYVIFGILLLFILITLVVAARYVQMIIDFFDRKKDALKKFLGSYKFNALFFLTLLTLLTLLIFLDYLSEEKFFIYQMIIFPCSFWICIMTNLPLFFSVILAMLTHVVVFVEGYGLFIGSFVFILIIPSVARYVQMVFVCLLASFDQDCLDGKKDALKESCRLVRGKFNALSLLIFLMLLTNSIGNVFNLLTLEAGIFSEGFFIMLFVQSVMWCFYLYLSIYFSLTFFARTSRKTALTL